MFQEKRYWLWLSLGVGFLGSIALCVNCEAQGRQKYLLPINAVEEEGHDPIYKSKFRYGRQVWLRKVEKKEQKRTQQEEFLQNIENMKRKLEVMSKELESTQELLKEVTTLREEVTQLKKHLQTRILL